MFWNKWSNMQIIFCDIFARVSDVKNLDIFQNIFLEHIFFLSQSSISGFSCFKKIIYLCMQKKLAYNWASANS